MKEELYEYACPKKRMTIQQADSEKKNQNIKMNDIVGYISIFFVLLVFSLPMAISKTLLWSIVLAVYVVILLLNRIIDKDPYSSSLLFFGATIFYLGIVLSYLIINGAYERFQYSSLKPLIVLSIIFVICYEITVFMSMLMKRYTARNQNHKSHSAIDTAVGTFLGGILGSLLARKLSPQIAESLWSVWLILLACSLLFVISFSFLQKYILYKILKSE